MGETGKNLLALKPLCVLALSYGLPNKGGEVRKDDLSEPLACAEP